MASTAMGCTEIPLLSIGFSIATPAMPESAGLRRRLGELPWPVRQARSNQEIAYKTRIVDNQLQVSIERPGYPRYYGCQGPLIYFFFAIRSNEKITTLT